MDNFFYKNLRYLRESRNLSLQQLADNTRISKSVLSQYEQNKSAPTLDKLLAIVQYFGCGLDDITERDLQRQPLLNKLAEPESIYKTELDRLRIENNTLREALREIGKGIKQ